MEGLVVDKKRALCVCVCVSESEETKKGFREGRRCVYWGCVQKGILACGCNRVGD